MDRLKKIIIINLIFLILATTLPIHTIAKELGTVIENAKNIDNVTTLDLTNIVIGEVPDHTHIWKIKYDEFNHWQECQICFNIENKVAHTLESNGGSKTLCENGYYNNAYREVCNCGYQSKPQVVLHGRYENWASSQRLNYGEMNGVSLYDIKQITYAEFNSISYPSIGGQTYTWSDPDGDGYGWVFCGGPILKDNNGTKGTIELILGTEGDRGRGSAFDEAFILARYIYSDSTPTLTEFINYLPASNTIPTDHLLYGYREKYQGITNEQWNRLVDAFRGYYTHTSSWGWNSMNIQHATHLNSGNWLYGTGACYDSSNSHNVSWTDGIKTNCDLCGASYSGNEDYEAVTWYVCGIGSRLNNGQTVTCSGHKVIGKGRSNIRNSI